MRADTGSITPLSTNHDVLLTLALQHSPPVVVPGQKASLGQVWWQVLVVAGSEQDMLPRRIGLHTCSRNTKTSFLQSSLRVVWVWSDEAGSYSPMISGLSSMRMSPVTMVLSLVKMICSRNSEPRCFSTQAYWGQTHFIRGSHGNRWKHTEIWFKLVVCVYFTFIFIYSEQHIG